MRLLFSITAVWLAGLAGLAGCASKSTPVQGAPPAATPSASTPPAGPAAPGSAASAAVPPRPALAAEQKRLAELFKGTPVVFSMQADGSLRVEVPLSFCFDRGAFVVKPALAAVLDRLARSQRGDTTRIRVTASGDSAASNPNLPRDRAASARDYMVARGVNATRVVLTNGAPGEGIDIVVTEAAVKR